MATTIVGKTLTHVDVASDGSHVRLNLTDTDDRRAALELPLDCANQLIMTLPHIVNRALRVQKGHGASRLVFPLDNWRLEQIAGDVRLILTLTTPDGFEVSFAIESDDLERMKETARAAHVDRDSAVSN